MRPVSFWGVCAGGGGDGAGQIHGVPRWDDAGESSVRAGGGGVCVQMQNKGYIHVPGAHRESVRSLPPSRARITGVLALAGAERRRRRMEGGRGVWLG